MSAGRFKFPEWQAPYGRHMDRLKELRKQYQEAGKGLAFPLSIEDRRELAERRQAILREAQLLAETLNFQGTFWFNSKDE